MAEPTEEQYQIMLIFHCALRNFQRWSGEQSSALGLTSQQHQFLLAVRAHPGPEPPSVGDISHYLLIRHHSAVELANRVMALGLVSRYVDPADHRRVRVQLTDKGRDVIARLSEVHLEQLERIAEQLRISPEFLGNLSQEFGDFLSEGVNEERGRG